MKLENEYDLVEISDYTIEDVGIQEEWVYDVEVNKTHNFFGNNILLHNSVFLKSKEISLFKILKEGNDLVKKLNDNYVQYVKQFGTDICTIEMEFEKVFKKILFIGKKGSTEGAKKKYAYRLLWKDGTSVTNDVKFTGFETRRSDTPRLTKIIQTKVVEMILDNVKKETIINYLKDIDKKIRTGKIPIEEIGFPKGISKPLNEYGKVKEKNGRTLNTGTPPVIVGARYANKYLGKRFSQGSKPKWTYIKHTPSNYPNTNIISFTDSIPDGFIPDYDLIINKILKMKLEEIFIASGLGIFPNTNTSMTTMSCFMGEQ